MAKATAANSATEVERFTGFSNAELKGLQSFDDLERLFAEREIKVADAAEDLGDGFALLKEKDILADTPLFLVSWVFTKGDHTGEFVSARVMCRLANGTVGKFIINDGGQGICKQLREWTDENGGQQAAMYVPKGLSKSEYTYVDVNDETKDAFTWYLSTSK